MTFTNHLKAVAVFIVLTMTLSINLEDNIIARLGIEASYLTAAVCALGIALLLAGKPILLVSFVILLSLNANMPADFSLNLGLDRDVYTGTMLAILVIPFVLWFAD